MPGHVVALTSEHGVQVVTEGAGSVCRNFIINLLTLVHRLQIEGSDGARLDTDAAGEVGRSGGWARRANTDSGGGLGRTHNTVQESDQLLERSNAEMVTHQVTSFPLRSQVRASELGHAEHSPVAVTQSVSLRDTRTWVRHYEHGSTKVPGRLFRHKSADSPKEGWSRES